MLVYSLLLLIRAGAEANDSNKWMGTKIAMNQQPVATFLVVFVFVAIWFVLGLCVFHLYLVVLNKTTNEELRGLHEFGSKYSIGFFGNIMHTCCMVPDSNVHIHHEALNPSKACEEIQKQTVCYVGYLGCPKPKEEQSETEQILPNEGTQ